MVKITNSVDYTSHFSGHETFPLRQMWLKKAFDQVASDGTIPKHVFSDDEAIARFGVGKNMVASIRHWALACDVMRDVDVRAPYEVTEIGHKIFADQGLDPYSEHPSTAWYAHWCLAGRGNRATTWYWLFNHVTIPVFSREDLEQPLTEFAKSLDQKKKLSASTLTRDIDTCIRSYAPRTGSGSPEDFAEPMLGELGLLHEEGKGHFSFRRGPKITLTDGMFAFALIDYWDGLAAGETALAFEAVAYGAASPGRVFKLDEDSVAEHLLGIERLTGGRIAWTDTAGLRQIHRKEFNSVELKSKMLEDAYV